MKITKYLVYASAAVLFSCDIDKTESGSLPEVEVEVESGELPEYDIDWADINVGTKTKTIKVPKVVVVMEEEEVEVPFLNVDMPDADGEMEERSVRVEAEVSEVMHDLNIEKIYAKGNRLMVISKMTRGTDALDGNRVRISDQLVLNAPDNLTVKHYIIGDRPEGGFNNNYKYFKTDADLASKLEGAKLIYED